MARSRQSLDRQDAIVIGREEARALENGEMVPREWFTLASGHCNLRSEVVEGVAATVPDDPVA